MKKFLHKLLAGKKKARYDFVLGSNATTLHGAIAQLGERLHGMQEVSGSIPLGSTIIQSRKVQK